MFNVRGLANSAIAAVNPHIIAGLKQNTGYTTLPNGKQVAGYAARVDAEAQVQALGASDLKHMADLNIQGVMRKVYLYGNWGGVVRADKTGGDLLVFPQAPGDTEQEWKVVTVFETWADWCSVGVVLQ